MNNRENNARQNFVGAAKSYINLLKNAITSSKEDSFEYMQAEDSLNDHEGIVAVVYTEGINSIYDNNVIFAEAEMYLDSIRDLGHDKLMDLADKVVTEMGY